MALFDIDNRNPKIDRKDPKRKPQNILLKSPTKTKKSPIKTKKRKKEREHHDRPDNNKQLRVDEQLDQSKILLEIEMMEELNRPNTTNKGIPSTVIPPLKRAPEENTSMELDDSTTNYHGQTNPATKVI